MDEKLRELALEIMCARCEARPHELCKTISGDETSALHAVRLDALREAYAAGAGSISTTGDVDDFDG